MDEDDPDEPEELDKTKTMIFTNTDSNLNLRNTIISRQNKIEHILQEVSKYKNRDGKNESLIQYYFVIDLKNEQIKTVNYKVVKFNKETEIWYEVKSYFEGDENKLEEVRAKKNRLIEGLNYSSNEKRIMQDTPLFLFINQKIFTFEDIERLELEDKLLGDD